MKRTICLVILFTTNVFLLFSDNFTEIIQDLAMQTACLGKYSMAETGQYGIKDPHNYYTEELLSERFAKMSGDKTKIETFYGVCFDYAQAAWKDINTYTSLYMGTGMEKDQFYIAGVDDDPNVITLSIPGTRNDYDVVQNGVYLKRKKIYNIKTHESITHHAWLWVLKNDGQWFWIDPTWTDTLGYVVWGYVSDKEEVQLPPIRVLCINEPPVITNEIPSLKKLFPYTVSQYTLDNYQNEVYTFNFEFEYPCTKQFSLKNAGYSLSLSWFDFQRHLYFELFGLDFFRGEATIEKDDRLNSIANCNYFTITPFNAIGYCKNSIAFYAGIGFGLGLITHTDNIELRSVPLNFLIKGGIKIVAGKAAVGIALSYKKDYLRQRNSSEWIDIQNFYVPITVGIGFE